VALTEGGGVEGLEVEVRGGGGFWGGGGGFGRGSAGVVFVGVVEVQGNEGFYSCQLCLTNRTHSNERTVPIRSSKTSLPTFLPQIL